MHALWSLRLPTVPKPAPNRRVMQCRSLRASPSRAGGRETRRVGVRKQRTRSKSRPHRTEPDIAEAVLPNGFFSIFTSLHREYKTLLMGFSCTHRCQWRSRVGMRVWHSTFFAVMLLTPLLVAARHSLRSKAIRKPS